jgi:phenylalanyl-tRNA synthetase alpha chain
VLHTTQIKYFCGSNLQNKVLGSDVLEQMTMKERLEQLFNEISEISIVSNEDLEAFRLRYLSRKGAISSLFEEFKSLPPEQKRLLGKPINALKKLAESKFKDNQTKTSKRQNTGWDVDLTMPGQHYRIGSVHPITQIKEEIIDIFKRIGFSVSNGPEIEDDWHNFSALNFPEEHPARDMQDTFFVEKEPDWALRTHTSSVQVRVMEAQKPPIRTLAPGRVFRNEAISARAHCMFHQIEGLYIDKGVSFADMKQTLLYFAEEFFGKNTKIRLRPSYFPFTEPSAEMDVYWGLKSEADYRITKGTGWLEVMGCGMVDPEVLQSSEIDPEAYSGYAFGMGLERIAMNRYQITDLRYFFENDLRFLQQFQA